MSELLTVGGHPLTYGGFLLGFIDPNPLNLPAYTMRFLFDDGIYNPSDYDWGPGTSWTRVSWSPNIVDYTKTGTDAAIWNSAFHVQDGPSLEGVACEVLGANTTGVTDMGNMFELATGLRSLAYFDTSNVTNMRTMFQKCSSLVSVPPLNASRVTDMDFMFEQCTSLVTAPLLNTRSVTTMEYMFSRCYALETVPQFDTGNVTDMAFMFDNCTSLKGVPLFNTSNVINMGYMFDGCTSLEYVPLFDTSRVNSMLRMFRGCKSLKTLPHFRTLNVLSMESMCYGCSSLTSIPTFNAPKVTDVSLAFASCIFVESGALALYTRLSTQANPPSGHINTFTSCGSYTTTGRAELAQIPVSWGGTGS